MPVPLPPVSLPTLAPVVDPACPVNVDLTCVYGQNSMPCETLTTTPGAANCLVDVLLEINSCNVGMVDIAPSNLRLDVNGTGPTGVNVTFLPGEPAGILGPNECYKASASSAFDVCIVSQYFMVATVSFNTADGAPLCQSQDTLSVSIAPAGSPVPAPTLPMPTMMPVPVPPVTSAPLATPTLLPVAPPSMMPVTAPVAAPTVPPAAPVAPVAAPTLAPVAPIAPVAAPTLAPVAPVEPGANCPLNVDLTCVYGPNNLPCDTLTTNPSATSCFVDVLLNINACNAGLEDVAPSSLRLDVNGTGPSGVDVTFLPGEPASILGPTECYLAVAQSAFDVCIVSQYFMVATVGVTTTSGTPICDAQDTLTVSIAPAGGPVPAPTMPMPTMMPIAPILPPPTSPVAPVISPVAPPAAQPSPAPISSTVAPALQGTGCIDVELGCVFGPNRAGCDTIVAEDQFNCTCADCARQLVFTYTARTCNGLAGCQDLAPLTPQAQVSISSGSSNLFGGPVSAESPSIVLGQVDGACLPASLNVEVRDSTGATVLQTFTINSACTAAGGGPQLNTAYGALSFRGYSCGATDVHNCLVDVSYEALTCNIDTVRLVLDSLNFNIDGTGPTDVSGEIQPNPVMFLNPSECYTTTIIAGLETCITSQFTATVTVGFRPSTGGGAVCTDQDQLTIGWQV